MRKTLSVAALLLINFASSGAVNAADFYVEAGVMRSRLKLEGIIEQTGQNQFSPGNGMDSETSVGWKAAGGYRLAPYLAIEAGYAHFGEVKAHSATFRIGPSTHTDAEDPRVDIKGPYVTLVGSYPVGRVDPFVKIGALRANTSASMTVVTAPWVPGFPETKRSFYAESSESTEFLLGLGVTYRITDRYGMTLETTYVPNAGDGARTGEGDLTVLSLGFQYRF